MFPSVLEIFSIGIGPSSSHTVGPMRAAHRFVDLLKKEASISKVEKVVVELYGSLAYTGRGHRTDMGIIFGLEGVSPEAIEPSEVEGELQRLTREKRLSLGKEVWIDFVPDRDILFKSERTMPLHPNALRITAYGKEGQMVSKVYYSVGGGFIQDHDEMGETSPIKEVKVPAFFSTAKELISLCEKEKCTIAEIAYKNELSRHSEETLHRGLAKIWKTMREAIDRGVKTRGTLPGGLGLVRRAPLLYEQLTDSHHVKGLLDPLEWVSMWAIAVNEENAASGKIVTAPTNGASGVIPACLKYCESYLPHFSMEMVEQFLLTSSVVAILFKKGASLSAAEMGCMGEVGVASAMAAASLVAVQAGTIYQTLHAAKMAIVNHLGLTCDPVKGLVQIPCIERNAMGATVAINCSLLALKESHKQLVTLDEAIKTMKETGEGMHTVFKETSLGGLAVNVIEC